MKLKTVIKFVKNPKTLTGFFLLFAALFSIFYQGYYYGQIDQSQYLPYVKKIADPSLYKSDLFVDAIYAQFPSKLWQVLARIYPLVNFEVLLFLLHVFARFLFFLAIFLLARQIFKKKEIAFLSVIFWMTTKPALGYDVLYNNFVHSQLGIPLCLFSILFLLKNRHIISVLFLIIAFYCHPPIAFYTLLTLVVLLIARKQVISAIKYIFILTIGIIPVVYDALSVTNAGQFDSEWVRLMKIRFPHQSFPFSWHYKPVTEIGFKKLAFGLVFIVSVFGLRKELIKGELKTVSLIILSSILTMGVFGVIFSEIFPIPKIIALHAFHASYLATVFGVFIISHFVYKLIISKDFKIKAIGFGIAYLFFFNQYNFSLQEYVLILLLPYLFIVYLYNKNPKLGFKVLMAVLIGFLPVIFYQNQLIPNQKYNSWINAQKWAKEYTNKDDIFIVPPYEEGFRLYAERPEFVEWKDGWGYISPIFIKSWWSRMQELGISEKNYSKNDQISAYSKLSEGRVRIIKKKYGAKYIVVPKKKVFKFKRIYENSFYSIYKISS